MPSTLALHLPASWQPRERGCPGGTQVPHRLGGWRDVSFVSAFLILSTCSPQQPVQKTKSIGGRVVTSGSAGAIPRERNRTALYLTPV